jgi:hypothetical protein
LRKIYWAGNNKNLKEFFCLFPLELKILKLRFADLKDFSQEKTFTFLANRFPNLENFNLEIYSDKDSRFKESEFPQMKFLIQFWKKLSQLEKVSISFKTCLISEWTSLNVLEKINQFIFRLMFSLFLAAPPKLKKAKLENIPIDALQFSEIENQLRPSPTI